MSSVSQWGRTSAVLVSGISKRYKPLRLYSSTKDGQGRACRKLADSAISLFPLSAATMPVFLLASIVLAAGLLVYGVAFVGRRGRNYPDGKHAQDGRKHCTKVKY